MVPWKENLVSTTKLWVEYVGELHAYSESDDVKGEAACAEGDDEGGKGP
jgi:hypothetical protein